MSGSWVMRPKSDMRGLHQVRRGTHGLEKEPDRKLVVDAGPPLELGEPSANTRAQLLAPIPRAAICTISWRRHPSSKRAPGSVLMAG